MFMSKIGANEIHVAVIQFPSGKYGYAHRLIHIFEPRLLRPGRSVYIQ